VSAAKGRPRDWCGVGRYMDICVGAKGRPRSDNGWNFAAATAPRRWTATGVGAIRYRGDIGPIAGCQRNLGYLQAIKKPEQLNVRVSPCCS